jgi:hypothetical protein
MYQPIKYRKTSYQQKAKLSNVKKFDIKKGLEEGVEKIKGGLKSGVEKVRKGVEKVQAFRKTPEGQLLEKAGLKFLKESGVRNKINAKIHEKVLKGVEKVQAFRKTPEGQLLEKAGLKFLKESGVGNKINDKIHEKLSEYTKDNEPWELARKIIHASADQYFKERESLPEPNYTPMNPSVNWTPVNTIRASPRNPTHYTAKRR